MCYVNVYTGYKYTVLSGVNVYTGHQYTLLIGMCVLRECLYCYKYTVLSGVLYECLYWL